MSLTDTSKRLIDALVGVYPEMLRAGLNRLDLDSDPELEQVVEESARRLRSELEDLLARPFTEQRRGPLQVFQTAFAAPTEILRERGVTPAERDELTVNALPGDIYDLAPASTREISDDVFDAHISWGLEKAQAMKGLVLGRVLGFEETGTGDSVVVLIHGFPLDHRIWPPLASQLADTHRCVMVDLAGRGHSELEAASTIEGQAADVLATLDEMGLEAVHLVGLSMGGYVALAMAEVAPQRLKSLVLADTKATGDDDSGKQGRDEMIQRFIDGETDEVMDEMLGKLISSAAPDDVRELVLAMGRATPVETLIADVTAMRDRPDRREALSGLECPVLVVVGADDGITPPAGAEEMATEAGARFEVIDDAGHLAPLERPGDVAAVLDDFLF